MKNEKGVTLIALVITIIVLIILAAVSIAMLTGDNGILSNAEQAQKDTSDSAIIDRIDAELNAMKADLHVDKKVSYATMKAAYDTIVASDGYIITLKGTTDRVLVNTDFDLASGAYPYDAIDFTKYTSIEIKSPTTGTGVTGSISLTSPYTITRAEID